MHTPKLILKKAYYSSLCLYHAQFSKNKYLLEFSRWFRDNGDSSLRLNYPLNSESVVVDVGGYMGDYASQNIDKYDCHVFIFEPIYEFYMHCIKRFSDNPKVRIYNNGLSNANTMQLIAVDADASSVKKLSSTSESQNIELKDADAVFNQIGITEISLLRMNIEGGEYDLLPCLIDSGWMKRIQFCQVQFHSFIENSETKRNCIVEQLSYTKM